MISFQNPRSLNLPNLWTCEEIWYCFLLLSFLSSFTEPWSSPFCKQDAGTPSLPVSEKKLWVSTFEMSSAPTQHCSTHELLIETISHGLLTLVWCKGCRSTADSNESPGRRISACWTFLKPTPGSLQTGNGMEPTPPSDCHNVIRLDKQALTRERDQGSGQGLQGAWWGRGNARGGVLCSTEPRRKQLRERGHFCNSVLDKALPPILRPLRGW